MMISAAARSEAENRRAVQLQRPKAPFWKCEVTRCSALQKTRIQDVWDICTRWNKGALECGVVCIYILFYFILLLLLFFFQISHFNSFLSTNAIFTCSLNSAVSTRTAMPCGLS